MLGPFYISVCVYNNANMNTEVMLSSGHFATVVATSMQQKGLVLILHVWHLGITLVKNACCAFCMYMHRVCYQVIKIGRVDCVDRLGGQHTLERRWTCSSYFDCHQMAIMFRLKILDSRFQETSFILMIIYEHTWSKILVPGLCQTTDYPPTTTAGRWYLILVISTQLTLPCFFFDVGLELDIPTFQDDIQ